MAYQDINPYRPVEYFRGADHSKELYDQMTAPIERQRLQQESDRQNAYRNASLARETARDTNADQRDRVSQEQRAREMLMQDRRAGQREDLYSLQEKRRQEEAMFNRTKLHQGEHEALIKDLYDAINSPGQDPLTRQNRILAAQDALKRQGYSTAVNENTPGGPTLPPAMPAPAVAEPVPDNLDETVPKKGVGWMAGQSSTPPLPGTDYKSALNAADAQGALGVNQVGKDRWSPISKEESARDNASNAAAGKSEKLSGELDAIDNKYSKGLGVAPGLLPGRSPVGRVSPQVAQADAMLDPADPYNKLVQ